LAQRVEARSKIVDTLLELGLTQGQIDEVTEGFDQLIIYDHAKRLYEFVLKDPDLGPTLKNQMETIISIEQINTSTAEKVETLLKDSEALNDIETSEALKDLKYYVLHRSLRRPELWTK